MCLDGHVDAGRPQALLGGHLRVVEGELLLPALLADRLQNGVSLCECTGRGRTKQPRKAIVP